MFSRKLFQVQQTTRCRQTLQKSLFKETFKKDFQICFVVLFSDLVAVYYFYF